MVPCRCWRRLCCCSCHCYRRWLSSRLTSVSSTLSRPCHYATHQLALQFLQLSLVHDSVLTWHSIAAMSIAMDGCPRWWWWWSSSSSWQCCSCELIVQVCNHSTINMLSPYYHPARSVASDTSTMQQWRAHQPWNQNSHPEIALS